MAAIMLKREKEEASTYKTIKGEKYKLRFEYTTKAEAESTAKWYRKYGHKVRVIKGAKLYRVYASVKKKPGSPRGYGE